MVANGLTILCLTTTSRTVINLGETSVSSFLLASTKPLAWARNAFALGSSPNKPFFVATVTHVALVAEPTKKALPKKWANNQVKCQKSSPLTGRERTFS